MKDLAAPFGLKAGRKEDRLVGMGGQLRLCDIVLLGGH